MNRETKGFEERLLSELRRVVAANEAPSPDREAPPPFAPSWRPLALAGGLAVAAVASVAVVGVGSDESNTAWAVTPHDDGTVTVEIDHLSDADGLERKLRDEGVPAIVQYLPEGKECAAPAPGEPYPAEFGWRSSADLPGGIAGEAPWGELETNGGEDGIRFTINPVPDGQSISITTQTRTHLDGDPTAEESGLRIEYFRGAESPCRVVGA